jgi:hypothetical protein
MSDETTEVIQYETQLLFFIVLKLKGMGKEYGRNE